MESPWGIIVVYDSLRLRHDEILDFAFLRCGAGFGSVARRVPLFSLTTCAAVFTCPTKSSLGSSSQLGPLPHRFMHPTRFTTTSSGTTCRKNDIVLRAPCLRQVFPPHTNTVWFFPSSSSSLPPLPPPPPLFLSSLFAARQMSESFLSPPRRETEPRVAFAPALMDRGGAEMRIDADMFRKKLLVFLIDVQYCSSFALMTRLDSTVTKITVITLSRPDDAFSHNAQPLSCFSRVMRTRVSHHEPRARPSRRKERSFPYEAERTRMEEAEE